ncbi:MAG: 50S ribosomal protein L25 [Patescibacteria group bacterium]
MQELKAERREITGKAVKTLRQKGFLPAVLYGEGIGSQAISVSERAFVKVFAEAGESTLVNLDVGGSPHTVLIHDVSHDPLRGMPIHADFYAVRMDRALRVSVPIVFSGESPAVKNEGGILVKVVQELDVEAMPADLPHEISADLAALTAIDSRITVKDLPRGERVKIIAPPDEIVALVEPPRSEEAMAELAAAPGAEIKEVKTEREVKAAEKLKEVETEEKE